MPEVGIADRLEFGAVGVVGETAAVGTAEDTAEPDGKPAEMTMALATSLPCLLGNLGIWYLCSFICFGLALVDGSQGLIISNVGCMVSHSFKSAMVGAFAAKIIKQNVKIKLKRNKS